MTHHVLPEIDLGALESLTHAHLIRDPRRVLARYAKVRERPTVADLGVAQQVALHRRVGGPVIDSDDLLPRSGGRARAGCARRCACPSTRRCSPGRPARASTDGVWAQYWYASVEASTGFGPWRGDVVPDLPDHLADSPTSCRVATTHELPPHRLRRPGADMLQEFDERNRDLRREHQRPARRTATRRGSARSTPSCRAATPSGRGCGSTRAGSSRLDRAPRPAAPLRAGAGVRRRSRPTTRSSNRSAARSRPTT